MVNYVFAYCGLAEDSFLKQGIGVKYLPSLRLEKYSYIEILHKIPAFSSAKFIHFNKTAPISLEERQTDLLHWQKESEVIIKQRDKVCVIDLRYYPKALDIISHLLDKSENADIPLNIQSSLSINPVIKVGTWNDVVDMKNHNDIATTILTEEQLVDLYIPINVLNLFSNNLILRHFNSLKMSSNGYFLKQSSNKIKIYEEHYFLSNLPTPLRPYYPQCGELVKGDTKDGYEIEIIPCIDVAKSLLNGFFNNQFACNSLVKKVEEYLNAIPKKKVSSEEYKKCMIDIYLEKTKKRIEQTLKLSQITQFDSVVKMQGWDSFKAFANAYLLAIEADIQSYEEDEFVYSHGDLFFGNMLYDPVKQSLKLIDPRGGKDLNDCWLPRWYDLAKLSHSFIGQYDLIIYEQLTIIMDKNLNLQLELLEDHFGMTILANSFKKMLQEKNISEKRLRLYEGSLFLSMIPLHKDSSLRMIMQLLRAIQIYDIIK